MKKLFGYIALLVSVFMMSGCVNSATAEMSAEEQQKAATSSMLMSIGIMVVFFVIMYVIAIRPQKKQEKEHQALLASMAVGDTVLTTAGFYGIVIDITADTVIVEFGNNKNCRIPMQKAAIVQLEHPEGYEAAPVKTEETKKDDAKK